MLWTQEMKDLTATMEDKNCQKNSLKTYGVLTSVQLKSKGQCEKSKLKQLNFFYEKAKRKTWPFCVSFKKQRKIAEGFGIQPVPEENLKGWRCATDKPAPVTTI